MIVGTAGHIDHGKTLLIKALTGTDTDRLKEEKARGITIELGFAYLPLPSGQVLGFVDVPGHERFVHTMLAGAAGIDFVMLVVAADDGVMPQTREHLQIIDLLGVAEGVVVLNKADLVDAERLAEVTEEIRAALVGSVLAGADVLPVSAVTGAGVEALRTRLMEEAESRPERVSAGAFRFTVDRVFTLAGAGTVATGTVVSGTVAVGDTVAVLPRGIEARVRSIHAHGRAADRGRQGERCALNLAGTDISREAVLRGDWLTDPAQRLATTRFDAAFALSGSETTPIRQWTPVHLHTGTAETMARVVLLGTDLLAPGGETWAQIVTEQPLAVRHGDGFVLRDASAQRTIGGGRVLDPRAPARRRSTPERLALLAALDARSLAESLTALLALPPGLVDLTALTEDRALLPAEVDAVVAGESDWQMLAAGQRRFLTTQAALAELGEKAKAALGVFHAAAPHLPGMAPEKLRLALRPRPIRDAFEAVLPALVEAGGIARQGQAVRLPTHSSALSEADSRLWERVRAGIEAERMRPPTAREIAEGLGQPVAKVRALCKTVARMGQLMEIAADRFFFTGAVADLALIAQRLAADSPTKTFTAAEFKDAAGTGRNVGIQVLEHFDRRGFTLRQGDARRVVKAPEAVFPAAFAGG